MTIFKVKCYEGGVWDNSDPIGVEAQNDREAAEYVCGGRLLYDGKPGQLRAEVWPASSPETKTPFYVWAGFYPARTPLPT